MHRNRLSRNNRTARVSKPNPIGFPVSLDEQVSEAQGLRFTEHYRFPAADYSIHQNGEMTFSEFVKTRFIPDHLASRGLSGKRFYYSILKHILNPGTFGALFSEDSRATKGRLKPIPEWPYLDGVRLCELSADHVRAIIFAAVKEGYSVQTVKHIRSVIGTIITHATRKGFFSDKNPAFQVALPNMIRRPALKLSSTYARQVLRRMQDPERQIAAIAMFTGLSLVEICALQWKQVNVAELPCRLNRHFLPPRTIAIFKPSNSGELQDAQRSRIKDVRLPELPLALLRKINSTGRYLRPDDYVFTSPTGTALPPEDLTNKLMQLGNEMGMPWISWRLFTKAHGCISKESAEKMAWSVDHHDLV